MLTMRRPRPLKVICEQEFKPRSYTVRCSRRWLGDADARRLLLGRMIDPLEHPKRGNSLTDTALLCLARERFQLLNTARALDIHISTLRYRVERIESILGISMDNPEDRFCLQVAAQMHRLVTETF
ncbi:carbohydrate diacid transcriptional activator CdaR [compost metagenome]